jgi:hypothetical protein
VASFSVIIRPEVFTEVKIVDEFESFLKSIGFLTATLLMAVENYKTLFFQYVFNGDDILKFQHNVVLNNFDYSVFERPE